MISFPSFLTGWRNSLRNLVTNWQSYRPNAQNGWIWLWSMVLPLDIELENMLQSVNDWAPGSPDASPSALPLIGQSRGILQGEAETDDHYAQRLIAWRLTTKKNGDSLTPAQQIQNYLGNTPTVRVFERLFSLTGAPQATYYTANPDGTTSKVVANWDWDSVTGWTDDKTTYAGASGFTAWAPSHPYAPGSQVITPQTGLVYQATAVLGTGTSGGSSPVFPEPIGATVVDNPGPNQITWTAIEGDAPFTRAFWSDLWIVVYPCEWPVTGTTLASLGPIWGRTDIGMGHAVPVVARDAVLRIVDEWKGAHTFVRAIIWSYDSTLFDPANPSASGNPNGTWGQAFNRTGQDDGRVRYWEPARG